MNKIAIIIVNFNQARFLRDLFASLARVSYPRVALKIFFLDNASGDGSSALARELLNGSGFAFEFFAENKNLGFTGGNNKCLERARDENFEFVFLLNPDTEVEPDFLEQALRPMADPAVAAAQSLILMGDRETVNSAGNALHFLGFSYCVGYREKFRTPYYVNLKGRSPEIVCASGAAVLLRMSALKQVGFFEDLFFLYHDDFDLSLRLRGAGFKIALAADSIVYHKYEFSRSIQKYFWMERNRFIVLLIHFRRRTLLLILPMLMAMEAGMFLFALRSGWWREKLRVYGWFFRFKNTRAALAARRRAQKTRVLPDRALARLMTTEISYQDIANPLLRHIGNPLMRAYWKVVKPLIRW